MKYLLTLLLTVATVFGAPPDRVPSYGPNGTHWPSLIPTPFFHDATANDIEVACSAAAISSAISGLTNTQVQNGVRILVQPGTIVGNGVGSGDTPIMQDIGSAAWSKRVLVRPRDGFGTVALNNVRLRRVQGVCFAGFTCTSIKFEGCNRSAFAWSKVTGWLASYGNVLLTTSDFELAEVVQPNHYVSGGGDSSDFFTNGGDIEGWLFDGCYSAPRYYAVPYSGGKPHTDTFQFAGSGGGNYSDMTIRDGAYFSSNNCAIQVGSTQGIDFVNSFVVAGEVSLSRYPYLSGGATEGITNAINGGGDLYTFTDGHIFGGIAISNTANILSVNGSTWNRTPAGQTIPNTGSWSIDTNASTYYAVMPPYPNDEYLNSIWDGDPYVSNKVSAPTISPGSGSYTEESISVSMATTTSDADIYYTVDGSTPDATDTLYSTPFTLSESATVKAIGIKDDLDDSDISSRTYLIGAPYSSSSSWLNVPLESTQTEDFSISWVTTPAANNMNGVTGLASLSADAYTDLACIVRFNPAGEIDARNAGAYANDTTYTYTSGTEYLVELEVDITNKTYDVTITSDPNGVPGTPTLIADDYAFRTEQASASSFSQLALFAESSSHSVDELTLGAATPTAIAPTFSGNLPGSYSDPVEVTLATEQSLGSPSIYYTTDGTDPDATDNLYSTPFTLSDDATVKARTIATGYLQSSVLEGLFEVDDVVIGGPPAAPPVASPIGGSYEETQNVTLTSGTGTATIYYTTDESVPDATDTAYTTPIEVSATTTIKAIAIADGFTDSTVSSFTYDFDGGPGDNNVTEIIEGTGVAEVILPVQETNRLELIREVTFTSTDTEVTGGLSNGNTEFLDQFVAAWRISGGDWRYRDGDTWINASPPLGVTVATWQVRWVLYPATYDLYVREGSSGPWTQIADGAGRLRAGPVDRTAYKVDLHNVTEGKVSLNTIRPLK